MNKTPEEKNNDEKLEKKEIIPSYIVPDSFKLKYLLNLCDELKNEINKYKPLKEDLWQTIQDKLMIDWTYHSNAIEGNTLTRGETGFFLQYGLTVAGKPLKDFLEVKNHADAIEYLFEIVKDERPIGTSLIKELNKLLLSGITYTKALNQFGDIVKKPARAGEYKLLPNHVLQPDGTIHYYVEPYSVPAEIDYLCKWINENTSNIHPLIVGTIAHYNFVRIHPFDDGNGRGARLLMNLILMKKKYPPSVIRNENRKDYIEALIECDNGNISKFIEFVGESLVKTQEIILDDLKKFSKI